MLIYTSDEKIIERARELGSSAKTRKGAIKFLKSLSTHSRVIYKIWDAPQLCYRGHRNPAHFRDAKAKEKYLESKMINRGIEFCQSLKLKTREEITDAKKRAEKRKLEKIANGFFENWPYRRSESSWAGGNHSINVFFGKPHAHGWSEQVWSRNNKWSGTDSEATIYITKRTLRHFPTSMTPDGLIVVDAKKIGCREFRITWVEQSKGFDLKTVDGYLIRGYHVAGKTVDLARKKAKKARNKTLETILKKRERRIEHKNYAKVWVGINDSLNAGNCRPATLNFLNQLKSKYGEIGGIRADHLLDIRDDIYTRRAVAAAENR